MTTTGVVTIRTARPEEYAQVGDLTARVYIDGGFVDPDEDYVAMLADASRRAAKADLLVAVDEHGAILGTVTVARFGEEYADICAEGELEFRMLSVAPEASGQGIGRALVRAVLDQARHEKLDRVVLSSQYNMTTAHRLYQRMGFQRNSRRDWSPVAGVELMVFIRELN